MKVLDTGTRSAQANMDLDATLLEELEEPTLHFYDWEGESATHGYFIQPEKFLNLERVKARGLSLARRPTGGGIVFHNCDLAFSVLIPASHPSFSTNPLDNYAFINRRVVEAIAAFRQTSPELLGYEPQPLDAHCRGFCMAKPTKYDVMLGGKKVGGAAQRKTKRGYLHQGSIALGMLPESYLSDVLAPETQVLEGMRRHTFPLLGDTWTPTELREARAALRNLLAQAFV